MHKVRFSPSLSFSVFREKILISLACWWSRKSSSSYCNCRNLVLFSRILFFFPWLKEERLRGILTGRSIACKSQKITGTLVRSVLIKTTATTKKLERRKATTREREWVSEVFKAEREKERTNERTGFTPSSLFLSFKRAKRQSYVNPQGPNERHTALDSHCACQH